MMRKSALCVNSRVEPNTVQRYLFSVCCGHLLAPYPVLARDTSLAKKTKEVDGVDANDLDDDGGLMDSGPGGSSDQGRPMRCCP